METTRLYKRDVSGKIRVFEAVLDANGYFFRTGLIDGKMVETQKTTPKRKNVGRSNETTIYEQSKIEVTSAINKKLDDNYVYDITKVDDIKFLPMRAVDLNLSKVGDYDYAQPKYDGIRCNIMKVGNEVKAFSRTGKVFSSKLVTNICDSLVDFFDRLPNIILDGELYNHDLKDDFEKIVSLVKAGKDSDEFKVNYVVYDCVDKDSPNAIFTDRTSMLRHQLIGNTLCYVSVTWPSGQFNLEHLYNMVINGGYEGLILRQNVPYVAGGKKSKAIMKYKKFEDAEFNLITFIEGSGNKAGMAASALIDLGDSSDEDISKARSKVLNNPKCDLSEFRYIQKAGMSFSNDKCRQLWKDRSAFDMNATVTVKYFKSNKIKLRFPKVIKIDRWNYE